MFDLVLHKAFEDEELKDVLKSVLTSAVASVGTKNQLIKRIILKNYRGEHNLQLYKLGFQLDPQTLGYGNKEKVFTNQEIQESLDRGESYQGRLNLLASDDLIKFISSTSETASQKKLNLKWKNKISQVQAS